MADMIQYTLVDTDWGQFGFVLLHRRLLTTYPPRTTIELLAQIHHDWDDPVENPTALPRLQQELKNYYLGRRSTFRVRLADQDMTPFRRAILKTCRRIPYGKTASYAELARRAGRPNAGRAVGRVCATNPFPIVVPCHRVVRSDGSLGGFSSPGGLHDKRRLLTMEQKSALT